MMTEAKHVIRFHSKTRFEATIKHLKFFLSFD